MGNAIKIKITTRSIRCILALLYEHRLHLFKRHCPQGPIHPLTQVGFFEHGDNGDNGDKCPNGDNGDKCRSTREPCLGNSYPPHLTSLRPYGHDDLLPQNLSLRAIHPPFCPRAWLSQNGQGESPPYGSVACSAMMLPMASIRASQPGGRTVVVSYCVTIAGPVNVPPAGSVSL